MENRKSGYLSATNENVMLISTSLKASGFNLIKRKDTVSGEIWRLFIDSSPKYDDGTFAEFTLYSNLQICRMSGRVNMLELEVIQQILFDCYEKIMVRDDHSEE